MREGDAPCHRTPCKIKRALREPARGHSKLVSPSSSTSSEMHPPLRPFRRRFSSACERSPHSTTVKSWRSEKCGLGHRCWHSLRLAAGRERRREKERVDALLQLVLRRDTGVEWSEGREEERGEEDPAKMKGGEERR